MERSEDETDEGFVLRIFEDLIGDRDTREELVGLLSSAEALEDWTFVSALGTMLVDTPSGLTKRLDGEHAGEFVRRTMKALISTTHPGTSNVVETLLSDISSYLADETISDAIRLSLTSLARRVRKKGSSARIRS